MLGVSERRVCKVLGQPRSTQRYEPVVAVYEQELTAAIVELASQYGRYGYRRIGALLRRRGWAVNDKGVERIWRQEGLKVPQKQPKRSKLWLNVRSCVRLRPQYRNHVWTYDRYSCDRHKPRDASSGPQGRSRIDSSLNCASQGSRPSMMPTKFRTATRYYEQQWRLTFSLDIDTGQRWDASGRLSV